MNFEDIPDVILRSQSVSRLHPGSIRNLGLVSVRYNQLLRSVIPMDFLNGDQYNLGRIYDAYHETDDEDKKAFFQDLIEFNMPEEISDCYAIQAKYSRCKQALFTEYPFSYYFISDSFPELSLMLLKHKRFTGKCNASLDNVCRPVLVDAFIQSMKGIDLKFLRHFYCFIDPIKLQPAIKNIVDASSQLKDIIATGSFEFLLEEDQLVAEDSSLYVLSHLTNENAEKVINILKKADLYHIKTFYMVNMVKYPHMKPVLMFLLSSKIDYMLKHEAVLALLDLEDYSAYYRALRGEAALEGLKYLKSFEGGSFRIERPASVSAPNLVETALVYSLPEEIMFVLIEQDDFSYTEHLMIAGLKRGVSAKFMEAILNRPFKPNFCSVDNLKNFAINAPISLETVKVIAVKWDLPNFFKKLLSCFDKSVPIRPYVQHMFAVLEFHQYQMDELSGFIFNREGVDSAEMVIDFIDFCFKKGHRLRWSFAGIRKQVADYLNAQTSEDLSNYLSAGLSLNDTSTLASETVLVLSGRTDGHRLISERFSTETNRRCNYSFWRAVQIVPHKSTLSPCEIAEVFLSNPNPNVLFSNDEAVAYLETLGKEFRNKILLEIAAFQEEEIGDIFLKTFLWSQLYSKSLDEFISCLETMTLARFNAIMMKFPRLKQQLTEHSEYELYKGRIASGEFSNTLK